MHQSNQKFSPWERIPLGIPKVWLMKNVYVAGWSARLTALAVNLTLHPMYSSGIITILTSTPKYDHITPILKELHWLPVQHRISFKIHLLTFKCLHNLAPISQWSSPPLRDLRSADPCLSLLSVPRSRTGFGDRSFEVAALIPWNSLPPIINSPSVPIFMTKLKTYPYNQAFPNWPAIHCLVRLFLLSLLPVKITVHV